MKIVSVVGTRPNFNKEMLVNKELKKRGINEVLVHTGQHYDYQMSQIFFQQCELPKPNYYLEARGETHAEITAKVMVGIERVLLQEKPDFTLVYGDVDSTLATAIASTKVGIPVAHVEAGPRCKFLYNPEEINRRVVDHISELLFAPTKTCYNNLIKENIPKKRAYFTGDLINDNLQYMLKKYDIKLLRGDYHLATIHRAENTDSQQRLSNIVSAFIESKEKIVFPVHPRTLKLLKTYSLYERLCAAPNIVLKEPQGYREFISLIAHANKVITDSGGVRREGYILGKPVITVIEPEWEWWPETVEAGWNLNTGCNKNKIIKAIKRFEPQGLRPPFFGDGTAAKKIVYLLQKTIKADKRVKGLQNA